MNVTTKTTALIRANSGHHLSLQSPEHSAYPPQPRGLAGSAVALTAEEYVRLLHPDRRKGSATIAQKIPILQQGGPGWTQHAVRIADLAKQAASLALAGVPDVYVTPNSFWGERLIQRLAQLCAAFSDLDYYRVARWRECSPETVMHAALDTLERKGIPLPSLVLFSGRGLLLLWLHTPLPAQALRRWNALQNRLFTVLTPLGADPSARDAARVFRLVGSVHGKTGETVRLLWSLQPPDSLPRWRFETLFERTMPLSRQELIEQRAQRDAEKKRQPESITRRGGGGSPGGPAGRDRSREEGACSGPASPGRHTGGPCSPICTNSGTTENPTACYRRAAQQLDAHRRGRAVLDRVAGGDGARTHVAGTADRGMERGRGPGLHLVCAQTGGANHAGQGCGDRRGKAREPTLPVQGHEDDRPARDHRSRDARSESPGPDHRPDQAGACPRTAAGAPVPQRRGARPISGKSGPKRTIGPKRS